ncbi:uncharacterized protein DUF3667 [Flavobacteriaceae bacterium MAR_2010_72]|nr:uncharacterized protein DUF3667 [Flavobacteriaceae bacterium MAR_2010_72]TVZ59456.1 uncharacterized protein DUF3667 [Flavobacteriaceae bacterium MAR_2010_105]
MSKEKLRVDKTCLNCQHVVEHRFCPNCGQENTEVTKSFHHLFFHFFQDLTHYDSKFWRTIFYLFLKPAALTKEYLSGKRMSFLAPIRLYIFISFITFFLITLLPNKTIEVEKAPNETSNNKITIPSIDSLHIEDKSIDGLTKVGILSQQNNDTIKKILNQTKGIDKKEAADFGYKSISELDSIQKLASEEKKISTTEYWFIKKWLKVKQENTNEQIIDKFMLSFTNNLPKVLFLYMPVFAFILWLFHDKKKWYYFDHSIFTLHYFSFILLLILILFFLNKLIPLLGNSLLVDWVNFSVKSAGIFWMIYYYFPAHRRLYEQPFIKSFFKSCAIIIINLILITLLTVVFALFTYINIQ